MKTQFKRFISFCIILGFFSIAASVPAQDIALKDDFESETLSIIWSTRKLSENALRHVTSPVRTGKRAIEITVYPHAQKAIGGENQPTERAEIREAPDVRLMMGTESWYAFSFYFPSDFPIVDTRLVIASWKQSHEPAKDRNPMVSLRYIGGHLRVELVRDRGQRKVFEEKIDLRNRWTDMIFHIIPKASKKMPRKFKDGLLQVWKNGKQTVDYKGALGFVEDEDEIAFRLSLYRDHMPEPMTIYFDRFRRGNSYSEVGIAGQ